jgi:chromosome segregation ATPase
MPNLDTRSRSISAANSETPSPVRENRIDPAHRMSNGRDMEADQAIAAVADDEEMEVASLAMVQQLRLQAQQLSRHLNDHQADLDRREAELQARQADVEQRERNNRLWLKDQHEDLSQREQELAARETQLQERARQVDEWREHQAELYRQQLADLEARRETVCRREADLAQKTEQSEGRIREIETAAKELDDASRAHAELAADLERRTGAFDARRDAVVEMIARFLEGRPVLAVKPSHSTKSEAATFISSAQPKAETGLAGRLVRDQFDELASVLAELDGRRKRIGETESLLFRAQSEVAELHQLLLAERKQFYAERNSQFRRLEDTARRGEAELAARRETLESASQQLEVRRAAVDQMRAQLLIAQREALENRLAAEELLRQIAGAAPSAQLSRQIALTKARIAESLRRKEQDIDDQRQKLESLAVEIGQQHDRLAMRKRELEQWLREQQADIESDAARLAAHEQEQARRQELLEKQRFDWEHERQEYQREIRRLLAELGQ